jgi:hypothetical protein
MAQLIRQGDGEGEAGALVQAIEWDEDGRQKSIKGNRPIVGCSLYIGSLTPRTYSYRDYWLTTPVVEILEETEEKGQLYVKFRTENSIYEFWT